eukprot:442133_1
MSAETISKWKERTSFPFSISGQPFLINNREFTIATSQHKYCVPKGDGIYKFNTYKNEWIKIFDYDENFECKHVISATYDNKNKLLYVGVYTSDNSPTKIVTFDLKTCTTNQMTLKGDTYNSFELIFAENKLHKICDSGDHYVYDTTEQFQK